MKKTLIIAWIATMALAGSIASVWTLVNAQSATTINWGSTRTGWTGGMHKFDKKWWSKVKITKEQMTAMQTAIKNNDYDAFVKADTNWKNITKEKFADMVTRYQKDQAKETAINNNDYNAFVTATTPTKDEFAKIVSRKKLETTIKTAITNNDYNAFVTALNSDTNKPADAKTPTQDEFTKIVEKAKANPDGNVGFGFGGGHHEGGMWPDGGDRPPMWENGPKGSSTSTTTTN